MSVSDDEISFMVNKVISEGDLTKLSFKSVVQSVEKILGEDLTEKKQFIKELVTKLLSEQTEANEAKKEAEQVLEKKEEEIVEKKAVLKKIAKEPVKKEKAVIIEKEDVRTVEEKQKDSKQKEEDKKEQEIFVGGFSKAEIEHQRLLFEAIKSGSRRETRGSSNGTNKRRSNNSNGKKGAVKKPKTVSKGSDEETVEGEGGATEVKAPPKKKRNNGFARPMSLSSALSSFLDTEDPLPRTEVVKRLYAYIKENNLQNPKDKRKINFDEKLQTVFKCKTTDFFKINKLLSKHVKPLDEVV